MISFNLFKIIFAALSTLNLQCKRYFGHSNFVIFLRLCILKHVYCKNNNLQEEKFSLILFQRLYAYID